MKFHRFRLQVSLKTLLAAVTLLCVALGCCVSYFHPQRRAVAAVLKLGGGVSYAEDDGPTGGPVIYAAEHRFWMDFVKTLDGVWLGDSDADDKTCLLLAEVSSLEHLQLYGAKITDRGVAYLLKLERLGQLDVSGTQITDAALDGIDGNSILGELHTLALSDTAITDESLDELLLLRNLTTLWISGTAMSDDAVAAIELELPHCFVGR